MRLSLRWKILRAMLGVVVFLLLATLAIVNFIGQRFVNETVSQSLSEGRRRIEVIQAERVASLRLIAQNVASFSNLRALLGTDEATIHNFLRDESLPRNPQADFLMVLDTTGKTISRSDKPGGTSLPDGERWVRAALQDPPQSGILDTGNEVYDAVAVPATGAGGVFCIVVAGAKVDDAFALKLRVSGSGQEVVLAGDRVLGSTIEQPKLPWTTRPEWTALARNPGQHRSVSVERESYLALPFALGSTEPRVLAVLLQSQDVAFRPYRSLQWILLGMGLAGVVVAVVYSARFSRSITAPVDKLVEGTQRVSAGDFTVPIDVQTGDEIGHLAQSFNSMLQGLREREAIGKFVSQSTIEAIQGNLHGMSAQGQRTTLTVFFSDIRGFTELTEKRAPEEVVKILNYCLSLQAQIVKKYGGDIDKFVGDCVVAHFYESSTNRSAMDAIQCSIEIEKALEKFNATLADGERIEVGIGLVTGEVVLGSIGSEDRRDFTAVGSNVNLASRLCGMAGPGEILLAQSCYDRVKDEVPAERLAPLTVKGFSTPIPVYRITVAAKATA